MQKRKLIRITGAFIGLLLSTICLGEKIYVFYPTQIRPKAIQQTMTSALSGMEITVFGRYTDFKETVAQAPPDAILTKSLLIKQFPEFKIKLNGSVKGHSSTMYVLLSVDKVLNLQSTTGITIGAVDFLGRQEMQSFVNDFFPKSPSLKRVTKLEDLLPLLTFNMVDGILITEPEVDYFKKLSHLNFKVTELKSDSSGTIALALKKPESAEVIKSIKSLPVPINRMLDVEQWR